MAKDDVVPHQVHRGSLVLDIHPLPDSLNLTNELAPSSSRSVPWLYEEKDQAHSLVVNAPSSLFTIGNHSSLSPHNWKLDLCGGVPCDLPRQLVRDAIAMSVSSRNNVPTSRLRDTT